MEMWKTAAAPMEKPAAFPQHSLVWRFTHSSTTPAAAAIHPFLSNPKRENKQKKEAGAQPTDPPKATLPLLLWESVENCCFSLAEQQRKGRMGNHKGMTGKCRHRRLFCLFPTLILAFFQALGLKLRTLYHSCPKTLLAAVGTAHAEAVVLPSAVLAQEESPLHPPFFCCGS